MFALNANPQMKSRRWEVGKPGYPPSQTRCWSDSALASSRSLLEPTALSSSYNRSQQSEFKPLAGHQPRVVGSNGINVLTSCFEVYFRGKNVRMWCFLNEISATPPCCERLPAWSTLFASRRNRLSLTFTNYNELFFFAGTSECHVAARGSTRGQSY